MPTFKIDGVLRGEASVTVEAGSGLAMSFAAGAGAAPVQLSSGECLQVAVITTPKKSATSPAQQLHELGVVDDHQTQLHQNAVSAEMARRGSSIRPELVHSGPNVTVAVCGQSVFLNQGS